MQLSMFRIGVLGAFFHVLVLAMMIVLSYFDMRRLTLYVQLVFLSSNALFSFCSLKLGFQFYGYGYFLATILTFAVTFVVMSRVLGRLPYQTFVLSNSSIQ